MENLSESKVLAPSWVSQPISAKQRNNESESKSKGIESESGNNSESEN